MEISKIIELLSYTLPSVITGLVAYYFFLNHTKNEERKMKLGILKENQKHSLPIRLQAYERMTLFLERINPAKLLLRVTSVNDDKNAYTQSLINTVEQEFEHNLAQQIYVSETAWKAVVTSKNLMIKIIRTTADKKEIENADQLRAFILENELKNDSPTKAALSFLKLEAQKSF